MSIQAFTIDLAQSTLDELRERLARTRWPDEVEGAGWDYGTNVGYLKELVDYLQHTFDWRAAERQCVRHIPKSNSCLEDISSERTHLKTSCYKEIRA
jgi:hypothetical protein